MKNIYISFLIFMLMLISIFFSIKYLNHTCNELEKLNVKLENSIKIDDWDSAENITSKISKEWTEKSDVLSIFVNHNQINDIENEVSKLTQYVKSNNKEESMACIYVIKFFTKRIMNEEKVNIQNIF